MKDPIVEEIRQTRDAHAKRFNCDVDAICDLRKREMDSNLTITPRPPTRSVRGTGVPREYI
jgi:hypothetical protein